MTATLNAPAPLFDLEALDRRDRELAGRPMPTPAYSTRRPAGLASRVDQVAAAISLYGRELIPWQRHAADLATCMNPPGSHFFWRFQTVIIVVPRQAGKTELAGALLLDRALSRARQQLRMTAQNGKYAGLLWRRVIDPLEQLPPLWETMKVGRSNGNEFADFLTGSSLRPFPPTRDALHSQTVNVALTDEAWSFTREDGAEMNAAVRPAMITRRDRQHIIISAMGDDRSTWLDDLILAGRASIFDPTSTTLYLEYSPPAGADPYDPATWEYHPALGHLVTLRDLAGETSDHANFVRSYLNISLRDSTGPVDLERWDALPAAPAPAKPLPAAVSWDVAIDGTAASIWSAELLPGDVLALRVVESRADTAWLAPRLGELARAGVKLHAPATHGQARAVTDALERAGRRVSTADKADESLAWASLARRLTAGSIAHDHSPALRAALKVARLSPGDNPAPSRQRSLGTIDALTAAQLAAHIATRTTRPLQLWS